MRSRVAVTLLAVAMIAGSCSGSDDATPSASTAPTEPKFRSTVLRPGEKYHEVTIHRFGTDKK